MDTESLSFRNDHRDVPVATAVARLIEAAVANFEVDRDTARDCIARASALLRANRVTDGQIPVSPYGAAARGGLAPWQLKRVLAYIDSNLGSTIRASEMTKLTRLSAGYFFRAFKTSLGVPPFAYIAEKRIERACAMMATSDEPLCQIAIECGLCDQSHFCRVFRRIVGVTPNVWRRAHYRGPAPAPSLADYPTRASRGRAEPPLRLGQMASLATL